MTAPREATPDRPPAFSLAQRLRASRPPYRDWLAGAPLWGAAMALSAMLVLYTRDRLESGNDLLLLALYFCGGLAAWLAALPLARFSGLRRRPETRFAAVFFWLMCSTVAFTAFFFAMQYRLFYAQWHEPFGSRIWAFQFIFTSASAVYQFAVLGLRLYLPPGLVFLVAAGIIMARRMR